MTMDQPATDIRLSRDAALLLFELLVLRDGLRSSSAGFPPAGGWAKPYSIGPARSTHGYGAVHLIVERGRARSERRRGSTRRGFPRSSSKLGSRERRTCWSSSRAAPQRRRSSNAGPSETMWLHVLRRFVEVL